MKQLILIALMLFATLGFSQENSETEKTFYPNSLPNKVRSIEKVLNLLPYEADAVGEIMYRFDEEKKSIRHLKKTDKDEYYKQFKAFKHIANTDVKRVIGSYKLKKWIKYRKNMKAGNEPHALKTEIEEAKENGTLRVKPNKEQ